MWGFTFAPPEFWKTENLEFRPAADVLESGSEAGMTVKALQHQQESSNMNPHEIPLPAATR
jgi:hypothetical protein